jgi:hypothetical protein
MVFGLLAWLPLSMLFALGSGAVIRRAGAADHGTSLVDPRPTARAREGIASDRGGAWPA